MEIEELLALFTDFMRTWEPAECLAAFMGARDQKLKPQNCSKQCKATVQSQIAHNQTDADETFHAHQLTHMSQALSLTNP